MKLKCVSEKKKEKKKGGLNEGFVRSWSWLMKRKKEKRKNEERKREHS